MKAIEKCKQNKVVQFICGYLGVTFAITLVMVLCDFRRIGFRGFLPTLLITFWVMLAWPYFVFLHVENLWNKVSEWFSSIKENGAE
jgi:hypothetical protein